MTPMSGLIVTIGSSGNIFNVAFGIGGGLVGIGPKHGLGYQAFIQIFQTPLTSENKFP